MRYLKQLEGAAGLNVSQVNGYGHPEPLIEYTLMTRMPGVAFRNAQLIGKTRQSALKALGGMLHFARSMPQAPLRESGLFFGDQSLIDMRWRIGSAFEDVWRWHFLRNSSLLPRQH